MSVHTPGPWISDGPYIVPSDHFISVPGMVVVAESLEETPVIANVFGPYGEECSPETKCNARLMAAAPDLYHAAYLALEEIESWVEVMDGNEDQQTLEALTALRDAIKKAEGR